MKDVLISREDRPKQSKKDRGVVLDKTVVITAPDWVQDGLAQLSEKLKRASFNIDGKLIPLNNPITLRELSAIARNESSNTTGVIKYKLYQGLDKETIIAIRDLVKHTVIVGQGKVTHTGGYGAPLKALGKNKEHNVYICDLPGIQFQHPDNTGRHVLIPLKGSLSKGILDDLIFTNTVGEKKATTEQAKKDKERYIPGTFHGQEVLFDKQAYHAFIAKDFVLAALALQENAKINKQEINFKFLKYGAGFFAEGLEGVAKTQLVRNLAQGIEQGLKSLLKLSYSERSQIKRIELPFFANPSNDVETVDALARIEKLCKSRQIEFSAKAIDALEAEKIQQYVTATTNCSDPHAPTGNEMNHGSVDAAIAENIEGKLNHFNAALNTAMQSKFTPVPIIASQCNKAVIPSNGVWEHLQNNWHRYAMFSLGTLSVLGVCLALAAPISTMIVAPLVFGTIATAGTILYDKMADNKNDIKRSDNVADGSKDSTDRIDLATQSPPSIVFNHHTKKHKLDLAQPQTKGFELSKKKSKLH